MLVYKKFHFRITTNLYLNQGIFIIHNSNIRKQNKIIKNTYSKQMIQNKEKRVKKKKKNEEE